MVATCKLGEKGCWNDGKCHYSHDCENKVLTNADRIRAMSDEELANMVRCPHVKTNWDKCKNDCFACRLEWLQQPAKGE